MRALLPDRYRRIPDRELVDRIRTRKESYDGRLIILGHHYQRYEIVALSDFRGDSLELSKKAAQQKEAAFIVFCGVNFMAQSAAILCTPSQRVFHPDVEARCPMADMARIGDVERAWDEIQKTCGNRVVPITYINSDAEIKAFCGRNEGVVCTSSNALGALDWGLQRGEQIFFLPDEHLGRNTAKRKGISKDRMVVWDPRAPLGGNSEEAVRKAHVILWKGYCHVHTWFTPEHIRDVREQLPDAVVVVHPECKEEVVDLADYNGSTSFIVRFVQEAPMGTQIAIGTEINLVSRLAREHPDKKILPLSRSLCPNMYKVSLNDLLWTLDELGEVNLVTVPEEIKEQAKIALACMLEIV